MLIRPAIREDLPAIAALLDALNAWEGYDQTTDTATLAQALFAPERAVALHALVAEGEAKAVVGVLLYYPGYDTLSAAIGYHVADVVVEAASRRQGGGRRLMAALAQRALTEDRHWISLTVLRKNRAARAFYEALGMQSVAVDFFAMGPAGIARCAAIASALDSPG